MFVFPPHGSLPLTLSQCSRPAALGGGGGGRFDALLLCILGARGRAWQRAVCLKAGISRLSTAGVLSGSFFTVQSCPARCRLLSDTHGPYTGFPGSSVVKNLPANAGDMGSIPGLGRSPGGGSGNPLQYSCLENATDREAWWATVHGVWTNLTRLSYWTQAWSLRTWCLGQPPTKKVWRHCQPPLGANPALSENHRLKGTGQRLIKPKDRRQCSVISYLCEKDWEPTTRVMSEESSSVFKKPTLKCKLSVVETTVYFFFFHLFLLVGG